MELRNLITFLKIIETGSFSKAAEQLLYSQSTVTIQIQQLEEELNILLFDRIGKKVFVTEKGREVAEYARQMVRLSEKISLVGADTEELQGALTIVSYDSLSYGVLPNILFEYHKRHPKVSIVVKTSDNFAETRNILSRNEADLCFAFSEKPEIKNLICWFSRKDKVFFVAPPGHSLAQKKNIPLEEIANESLIVSNKHISFDFDFKGKYDAFKNYKLNPAFDVFDTPSAVELVKLGAGILLVPHYLVAKAEEAGELCVLDVPEVDNTIWIQALYHPDKSVTPQMNAFFALLNETYPE